MAERVRTFFQDAGCSHFPQIMALVHLPSLACPVVDVLSKDARLLQQHTPSAARLVLSTTAFHVAYELWLYLNLVRCGGAIPYPWYYDIGLSPAPRLGFVAYGLIVNAALVGVVLGVRYVIMCRAKGAHAEEPPVHRKRR